MAPATSNVLHSQIHLRTRPISARYLRSFEAVARHLNFSAAASEMALTQSTLSRQIQLLEADVGVSLFLRHTRSVELTSAGAQLLPVVSQSLPRIDAVVRQIRQSTGRRAVSLICANSFASMWLIPRLEEFQRENPDIDIRVENSITPYDAETSHDDVAVRYGLRQSMPPHAVRLFGDQLTPAANPRLLRTGRPLNTASDIAQFPLVEAGDIYPPYTEWLTWQRWFDRHDVQMLQPKRWLYFDTWPQMVQAATAGQGMVLARLPLVTEAMANGDLIEALPSMRLDSPLAYYLIIGQNSRHRPEVKSFCEWLIAQSRITRVTTGELDTDETENWDHQF